jgi:hypothetical protein
LIARDLSAWEYSSAGADQCWGSAVVDVDGEDVVIQASLSANPHPMDTELAKVSHVDMRQFFITEHRLQVSSDVIRTMSDDARKACRHLLVPLPDPDTASSLYVSVQDPYSAPFRVDSLLRPTLQSETINTRYADTVFLMARNLVVAITLYNRFSVPLNFMSASTTVVTAGVLKLSQVQYAGMPYFRYMCDHQNPLPRAADYLLTIRSFPPEILRYRANARIAANGGAPVGRLPEELDPGKSDVYMLGSMLQQFLVDATAPESTMRVLNRGVLARVRELVTRMTNDNPVLRPSPQECLNLYDKALGRHNEEPLWKKVGGGSFGCVGVIHDDVRGSLAKKLFYDDPLTLHLKDKTEAAEEIAEGLVVTAMDPDHRFTFAHHSREPLLVDKVWYREDELAKCGRDKFPRRHIISTETAAGSVTLERNPPVSSMKEFVVRLERLFEGLATFRTHGYVHHDINVRNIVLDPSDAGGVYKFIDFGMGGRDKYRECQEWPNVALYPAWAPEFLVHSYVGVDSLGREYTLDQMLRRFSLGCVLGDPIPKSKAEPFLVYPVPRVGLLDSLGTACLSQGSFCELLNLRSRELVVVPWAVPYLNPRNGLRQCVVYHMQHFDTAKYFEDAVKTGSNKQLGGHFGLVDSNPAVNELEWEFLSRGDVYSLGLAIMTILLTDPSVTRFDRDPRYHNLFVLLRQMIEIDVSRRISAVDAFRTFQRVRDDDACSLRHDTYTKLMAQRMALEPAPPLHK